MAIVADVTNGVLNYNYTDSSDDTATGSDLGYDQFLQLLCAEMQYQDPLEPTSNTDYVAQLATFSQLEATLSLQETSQNSMANDLVGKHVILATETTTGATQYVEGTVDYVMYQNGEVYLSVNDNLYSLDTLDTVADEDYYEAASLANTFSAMLAECPDVDSITSSYSGALSEIREVYDNMTDYQKGFVSSSDLATLVSLENRVTELKNAEAAAAETEAEETESTTEEE